MCDYVRSMQVVIAEVKCKLTGIETAQYSYYYYVFLLRLFLSLNYSRDTIQYNTIQHSLFNEGNVINRDKKQQQQK